MRAGSLKLGVGGKQGCRGEKKPGGNVTEKLECRTHTGVTWVEGRMLGRPELAPAVQAQVWKPERLSLGCRAWGLPSVFPPVRSLRSHTCARRVASQKRKLRLRRITSLTQVYIRSLSTPSHLLGALPMTSAPYWGRGFLERGFLGWLRQCGQCFRKWGGGGGGGVRG